MAHADSYHCEAEGCPTGIRRVPVNHSLICEHCYKSVSIKHNQLVQKGERIKAAVGNKSHNLRYKALNMHSYFHRGSIEFRHHEGTTDYETIVGFARICAALIDAVNRLPEKAILALPKNSRKAMLAVLPPDLAEYIGKAWSRNDAIRNGPEGHQYRNMYQQVWGL